MAPARARRLRRRPARARLARGRLDEPLRRRDPHAVLRRTEHPDRTPLAGGVRAYGRDRAAPVRVSVPARPTRGRGGLPGRSRAPASARRPLSRALDRRGARDRPAARPGGPAQRHVLRTRRVRVARVGRAVVRARHRRPPGLRGDGHPGRGRTHRRRRDDEGGFRVRHGRLLCRQVVERDRGDGRLRAAGRGRAAAHVVLPRGRWASRAPAPDHRLHHLVLLPPRGARARLRREGGVARGGRRARRAPASGARRPAGAVVVVGLLRDEPRPQRAGRPRSRIRRASSTRPASPATASSRRRRSASTSPSSSPATSRRSTSRRSTRRVSNAACPGPKPS